MAQEPEACPALTWQGCFYLILFREMTYTGERWIEKGNGCIRNQAGSDKDGAGG
jgi:hypothetical protein